MRIVEAEFKTTKAIELIKELVGKRETILFIIDVPASNIRKYIKLRLVGEFDIVNIKKGRILQLVNGTEIIVCSEEENIAMKSIIVKNIIMDNSKAPEGIIERAKSWKDSNIILVVQGSRMNKIKNFQIRIKIIIGKWWVKNFAALKKWASS